MLGDTRREGLSEKKVWKVDVEIEESPERTDAKATLRMGDAECVAVGHARRNPIDENVPRIGEELATARALSELSHKLLEESARIIESHVGHAVELNA